MNAIILVGGLGTRLRPLTLHRPKGLMPILNKPFLSYQMEKLKFGGVKHVMLAAGLSTKPWKKDFERLSLPGLKVHCAFEPRPLGTGGAIRFAFDRLSAVTGQDKDPVIVLNGDAFLDLDVRAYAASHRKSRAAGSLALTYVDDPSRFGVVVYNAQKRIQRFIEKPEESAPSHWINAGAYILERSIITGIPPDENTSIERQIFPALLKNNKPLFAYLLKGYWNDIGTPASYLAAHRDMLNGANRWTGASNFRKRAVLVGAGSRVHANANLNGFVSLGRGCRIDDGATITDSVLLDGVTVGKNARISGAIIGAKCKIESFVEIKEGAVVGDNSMLSDHSKC